MKLLSREYRKTPLVISQHWFRKWLGAIRLQVIICTWVHQDLQHHMVSPGLNELRPTLLQPCLLKTYISVISTFWKFNPSTVLTRIILLFPAKFYTYISRVLNYQSGICFKAVISMCKNSHDHLIFIMGFAIQVRYFPQSYLCYQFVGSAAA